MTVVSDNPHNLDAISTTDDKGTVSIATLLAVCFGLLVVLAVAAVLFIGFFTSRENTLGLLNEKSMMIIGLIETRVRNHLDPALYQARFIDRQVQAGVVDQEDQDGLEDLLIGTLAATPQVTALVHWDTAMRRTVAEVGPNGQAIIEQVERDGRARILAIAERARKAKGPFWGDLVYSEQLGVSLVNLIQPLRRDGQFSGFIAIVVSMPELSEFITSVGDQFAATAYILYGKDRVLAHPNLTSRHPDIGEGNPAVRLNRVGDPVLAGLTSRERVKGFERAAAAGVNVDMVTVADETFVVFNGRINDYGGVPWTVGAYVPEEQVNTELRRLLLSGLAGLSVLAVSILAAIVMGRRLARPIRRMARSAAQVGTLDLDDVAPLMPSRIRELQDQASAFNTMLGGLRWFETYVPRSLVRRLMASGESRQFESAERDVTVLFTDIVGFTPLSESMPAAETAALLNRHFALLGACIESEGGTIDKFIGDALMAFWGAPEAQDDHAARACRAANAIVAAVAADNAQRRERGLPALRMRIGIHSGPVVVGNIGAPGRINYTIVGDTVNAAQRLEALGKELDDGADVTVLVSATAADAVGRDTFDLAALAAFGIKGKQASMEVFRFKSIP